MLPIENYQGSAINESLAKIIGGNDALHGNFPHQVQLKYFGDHLCGGTLISTFLILTAAHCISMVHKRRLQVISGEHRLSHNDSTEQYRDVQLTLIHERYNDKTYENDIAIVVVSSPLIFDNFTRSVLIPSSSFKLPEHADVSGWGRMLEKFHSPGDTLQTVRVPIADKATCIASYSLIGRAITDKMICAGEKSKDSCKADSGGPLTCVEKVSGLKYICGIVSFGFGCGRESFPGIYTDVSKYFDWIEAKSAEIRENNFCPPDSFRCRNDKCIPKVYRCDDDQDCGDAIGKGAVDSDEENCDKTTGTVLNNATYSMTPIAVCRQSQFRCNLTQCIPISKKCDGRKDCGNGLDETNCTVDFGLDMESDFNYFTFKPLLLSNSTIKPIPALNSSISYNQTWPNYNETGLDSINYTTSNFTTPSLEFALPNNSVYNNSYPILISSSSEKPILINTKNVTSATTVLPSSETSTPLYNNAILFTNLTTIALPQHYNITLTTSSNNSATTTSPTVSIATSSPPINVVTTSNFTHETTTTRVIDTKPTFTTEIPITSNETTIPIPETVVSVTEDSVSGNSNFTTTTTTLSKNVTETTTFSTSTNATTFTTTTAKPKTTGKTLLFPLYFRYCGRYKFQCKSSGECISIRWKCDGVEDCLDGSDELDCPFP